MITFFLIALTLALVPGPDNIYVLTQSIQRDKTAGLTITAGLCSGLLLHTVAAALGVSIFFHANPTAFSVLRLLGSLYLLYLAVTILKEAPVKAGGGKMEKKALGKLYLKGIVMNLTNPKILLFFLAFLPQFVHSDQNPFTQTLLLGTLFILATGLIFGSIALAAGAIKPLFRSVRFVRVMNFLTAAIFVILAVKLLSADLA